MNTAVYLELRGSLLIPESFKEKYENYLEEDMFHELYMNVESVQIGNERFFYSVELLEKLKQLRNAFTYTLLLTSDNPEEDSKFASEQGLAVDTLKINNLSTSHQSKYMLDQEKYRTVLESFKSFHSCVWIDHSAVQYHTTDIYKGSMLTVMPDPFVGLSTKNVTSIEEFLEKVHKQRTSIHVKDWFDEEWDASLN